MKKNIVVWLKRSQKETFAPTYHKAASYQAFVRAANDRHNLFFAHDGDAYRGGDVFSVQPNGELVRADVVYNLGNIPKPGFRLARANITNTPEFREFCLSKIDTYRYLPEFSPLTFFASNENECKAALQKIAAEKCAWKPNCGMNGIGVRIFQKDAFTFDEEMKQALPDGVVIQEFVDTGNGIPGICGSHHDLRIVTINEKPALSHVRIPPKGSLIANYHQGADITELDPAALPKPILDFYERVRAKVRKRFPRPMYSMDIGMTSSGPRLFELNGHTAFPWPHFRSLNTFVENLVLHLESLK